jgi:hypothetical protein
MPPNPRLNRKLGHACWSSSSGYFLHGAFAEKGETLTAEARDSVAARRAEPSKDRETKASCLLR